MASNQAPLRTDIVAAATRVFSRRGYHGATMTEIGEEAGMRKASLYHHVQKKEDLLFAIHDKMIDELIAETMAISSSSDEPPEKLRQVLHVTMDFIARNRDGVTVFLSERHVLRGDRWQVLVVKRDFYEQMVKQIVTEGVSSSRFIDLPPGLVARAILGMANWGYTWFQPDGPMSADAVAEAFSTIALHGLEAR